MPERLEAYKNAYVANKQSQFYAEKEFETSNALLLDLLQTERDFLDASESLIETLRTAEIQKYTYLQLTGELGQTFEVMPKVMKRIDHWFWSAFLEHKSIYTKVMLAATMVNFMSVGSSIFIMVVYDRVVPNSAYESLYALTNGYGINHNF